MVWFPIQRILLIVLLSIYKISAVLEWRLWLICKHGYQFSFFEVFVSEYQPVVTLVKSMISGKVIAFWASVVEEMYSAATVSHWSAGITQCYSSGLRPGWLGVRVPIGAGNFSPHHQPPIQWVQRALSLGVKRPGHEADHSPPSSSQVKNA
jgi:hypothetical protein